MTVGLILICGFFGVPLLSAVVAFVLFVLLELVVFV